MSQDYVGEFEQMVLLSIMRLGADAYGLAIRDELATVAGRSPSSGSLYTTLDRMERKGYLKWVSEVPENSRRKARQRRFSVTANGLDALKSSRRALITLWDGLEPMLED